MIKVTTGGTQKESRVVELKPKNRQILHYDLEYDFTKPEKTISDFVKDINGMLSRFEGNKVRLLEIDDELQDLFHFVEIASYKNVPEGYKLYRKMAELRRERRACKNENDLLQPIYEYFHATEVLNKLSHVQGECSKAKDAIDMRYYSVRTDILDDWFRPPKEKEDETTVTVGSDDDADDSWMEPIADIDSVIPEENPKTDIPVDKVQMDAKFHRVWKAANG